MSDVNSLLTSVIYILILESYVIVCVFLKLRLFSNLKLDVALKASCAVVIISS